MNEEDQIDPLSFKGQMAARYRERLSMGFALENGNKSATEDINIGSSNTAGPSLESRGAHLRQDAIRPTNDGLPNEPRARTQRNPTSITFPSSVRSRSGGEHQPGTSKPTMKELITKFETRSLTSGHLKQSEDTESEGRRIARAAWGSSSHRIKMELDPSALTSSSSSDVIDSKSTVSLSKPPHAKISRATLSLNNDTNKLMQHMVQPFGKSVTRMNTNNAVDKSGAEDTGAAPNPSRFCLDDFQDMKDFNQQQTDTIITTDTAPEMRDTVNSTGGSFISSSGKTSKAGWRDDKKSNLGQKDSVAPTPLRVSLRGIAARRKTVAGNKYIVHKKEWGKRLANREKDPECLLVISNHEAVGQDLETNYERSRDNEVKDVKVSNSVDVHKECSSKTRHPSCSPHSSNTAQKAETRSSSRQSEKAEEKFNDEKKRTKAMERYLQFLKSTNPPLPSHLSGVKSVEKNEQRKALRPPTPHRVLALRKRSAPPRHIVHHARDNNMQETLRLRQKLNRESRTEPTTRRKPTTKPPLSTDRKDLLIDPSGGDFFVNAAFSSTNSVDSSVCDFPSKLSPDSRTGQPKSEGFNVKLSEPLTGNRPTSIWAYLSGKNTSAKTLLKNQQIRPIPLRSNDINTMKPHKQLATFLRARSSSVGKPPETNELIKPSTLLGISPKSLNSGSSKSINPLFERSPTHKYHFKGRKGRSFKCDSSDIGSLILTEDEIADNDLVPIHLRERTIQEIPGNISIMLSSSDDSYSGGAKTPLINPGGSQLKKIPLSSHEKHLPVTPLEPQYFDRQDGRSVTKYILPLDETKHHRSNTQTPQVEKMSSDNKVYVIHGKRRLSMTPTKCASAEHSLDDSSNHQSSTNLYQKGSNVQFSENTKMNKPEDLYHSYSMRDSRDIKSGSNLHSNVVPDERRSSIREGRERKIKEDAYIIPESLVSTARGDTFQAPVENAFEKGYCYLQGKSMEPMKESPTRRSTRHLAGRSSSMGKDLAKERKEEMYSDTNFLSENYARLPEAQQRLAENTFSFHFGHNEGRDDAHSDQEKMEKVLTASPQKKRRKADQTKKLAKKKKRVEDIDDELSSMTRPQITAKISTERKAWKEKVKENKDKEDNQDKTERTEKDKFDYVEGQKSAGDLSVKSHLQLSKHKRTTSGIWNLETKARRSARTWIGCRLSMLTLLVRYDLTQMLEEAKKITPRKAVSRENSASSVFSDYKSSPKNQLLSVSPDKSSIALKYRPAPSPPIPLRPVQRLSCEPTSRFPIRSQIPLLNLSSVTPRSKLDRLIQYRRWREAMLDCLRPSRLPMSVSFRKTLDSAVMEEWALHCWQPSRDMYVDSQGIWWSASYQEVENGDVPESLLGDGRLLSKEGLLDLTARLPYMKVGPVRFLHATYVLMAAACVTLGHMGVRLYHCGGDDYEYYCADDDVECLMQML